MIVMQIEARHELVGHFVQLGPRNPGGGGGMCVSFTDLCNLCTPMVIPHAGIGHPLAIELAASLAQIATGQSAAYFLFCICQRVS